MTLADLTLVAAASSTSQLAASHGESHHGEAHHASHAPSGGHHPGGEKRSREAEQLEIEVMAQHLVEELRRRTELERERMGDTWGS